MREQFNSAAATVEKAFAAVEQETLYPELAQAVAQAKTGFATYAKTTGDLANAVLQADQLYETTMVPQIVAMQRNLRTAADTMASDFHTTTAATQAGSQPRMPSCRKSPPPPPCCSASGSPMSSDAASSCRCAA